MTLERCVRVLVIDDDAPMRAMVVCMLESAGFEAQAAADADEALFALQAQPYAIAVCDVHMPRRDGFAFARAAHAIRPTMPVVLMSSFGCGSTRREAFAAGAADFIAKPFSSLELRNAMSAALAPRRTASAQG
jgi:DNA-binding response OmpR family regulator